MQTYSALLMMMIAKKFTCSKANKKKKKNSIDLSYFASFCVYIIINHLPD